MLVGLLNFFNKCSCRNLCLSWTYLIEFGLESFGSTYQSVRATSLGPRSLPMEGVVKKQKWPFGT